MSGSMGSRAHRRFQGRGSLGRFVPLAFAVLLLPLVLLALPVSSAAAEEVTFSISGTVTGPGGEPLEDVVVQLRDEAGDYPGYAWTDSSGIYVLEGLVPGSYKIFTSNYQGYVDEWYDNHVHQGNYSGEGADPVNVTTADATGISFQLELGRSISGIVTNDSGQPLSESVWVDVYDTLGNHLESTSIDSDGTYAIAGLLPGSYKVHVANSLGYINEWYDNIPDQGNGSTEAGLVDLSTSNATGINFKLDEGRSISGTVTGPGGEPLEDVFVRLRDEAGNWLNYTWTDSSGNYLLQGLVPDSYKIMTSNDQGYVDEWYALDYVIRAGNDDGVGAGLVNVSTSNAVGVDFDLQPGFTISGEAVDGQTGGFIPGIGLWVQILGASGESYGGAWVDSDQTSYESTALPAGLYYLRTFNYSGYLDEWYPNLYCLQYNLEDSQPISLTNANATGIDFALELGRMISGTVTNESGQPLSDSVWVWVRDALGNNVTGSYTDSDGTYSLAGLLPGSYRVHTGNTLGYLDEWYDNVPYADNYSGEGADLVSITRADATDIDFQLALGRSVSGTVTNDSGQPLSDSVRLGVYDEQGERITGSSTQSDGTYIISGLAPGSYKIRTWNNLGYVDEWYENVFRLGDLVGQGATLLDLSVVDATDIDFQLSTPRSISGTVTSDSGAPVQQMRVEVKAASEPGVVLSWTRTDSAGQYQLGGLPPGDYLVRTGESGGETVNACGWRDEWYANIACEADPTGSLATPVNVSLGDQAAIDLQLTALDITPPETDFAFLNPFFSSLRPWLAWAASDDYRVSTVQGLIDGEDAHGAYGYIYPIKPGTVYGYIYPGADLAEGAHTAQVAASDYVGNVDPSPASLEFTVDTTAPVVTWDAPADGVTATTRTVTFSGTLNDATSGAAQVDIEVVQGAYRSLHSTVMSEDLDIQDYIYPGSGSWSTEVVLPTGTSEVRVRGIDGARNASNWTTVRTVTVDIPGDPILTITSPSGPGTYASGDTMTVGWTSDQALTTGEFGVWVRSSSDQWYIGQIVPATGGTGFSKTITLGLPAASGYQVIVAYRPSSSAGWGCWATSWWSFEVTSGDPFLTVTTPSGPGTYASGDTMTVSWTSDQNLTTGEFGVWVRSAGDQWYIGQLVSATGGTGFSKTITLGLPAAGGYQVIVAYRPSSSAGWGSWATSWWSFQVTAGLPYLSITAPSAAGTYTTGQSLGVTWISDQNLSSGEFGVWVRSSSDQWYMGQIVPAAGGTSFSTSLPLADLPPASGYQVIVAYRTSSSAGWGSYTTSWATFTVTGS